MFDASVEHVKTASSNRSSSVNIHEYQAKQLLRDYGVAGTGRHAGDHSGRGGGGGARACKPASSSCKGPGARGRTRQGEVASSSRKSPSEQAKHVASEILGMTLRSHQTGPEGKVVRKVYVEAGSEIEREYYLAIVLDRSEEKLAIIASTEGGMEIEEVAARSPEKILTVTVDPNVGLCRLSGAPDRIRSRLRPGPDREARFVPVTRCYAALRRKRMPPWSRSTRSSSRRGGDLARPRRQAQLR